MAVAVLDETFAMEQHTETKVTVDRDNESISKKTDIVERIYY